MQKLHETHKPGNQSDDSRCPPPTPCIAAVLARHDIPLLPYFLKLAQGKDAVLSSEFNQRLDTPDHALDNKQVGVLRGLAKQIFLERVGGRAALGAGGWGRERLMFR